MVEINRSIRGVYAITAEVSSSDELLERAERALLGGATILQYRDKSADAAKRRREAAALLELCQRHGAIFIVNDDVELAAEVGAHGVHLGRDDAAIAAARRRLGAETLIGASCYDSLELAEAALAAGADYVAFGSFFASPIKPQAVRPPLSLLTEAKRRLRAPVVAIGGITADNAASVIEAGADAVAVISAVFLADDPQAAASEIARLFDGPPADRQNRSQSARR